MKTVDAGDLVRAARWYRSNDEEPFFKEAAGRRLLENADTIIALAEERDHLRAEWCRLLNQLRDVEGYGDSHFDRLGLEIRCRRVLDLEMNG